MRKKHLFRSRRADLAAARKRRERLYEAAVIAGHPLAREAEFFRAHMRRYPPARAQYLDLRDQVIAAVEGMFT